MENRSYDPLDAILDAALNSYAEAEPLTGLEQRILNRARVVQSGIRSRHWPLPAIGITALALLCLFVAGVEQKRIEPKTTAQKTIEAPVVAILESPVSLPRSRQLQMRHPRALQPLPKREQFPTPQPPNTEERAMLRFIERDPKEAAEAFGSLQGGADKPVEIEPLDIKPLQIDGVNN